jgi:hypothetical protein
MLAFPSPSTFQSDALGTVQSWPKARIVLAAATARVTKIIPAKIFIQLCYFDIKIKAEPFVFRKALLCWTQEGNAEWKRGKQIAHRPKEHKTTSLLSWIPFGIARPRPFFDNFVCLNSRGGPSATLNVA